MIEIRNLSPSSINAMSECPIKFFMSYGLNYYAPTPWHSTILGTACHHLFELIAKSKILARDGRKWEKDSLFGRVYADKYPIDEWKNKLYEYYVSKDGKHLPWNDSHWQCYNDRITKGLADEWSPMNLDPNEVIQTEFKVELPIDKSWAEVFTDRHGTEHKHLHLKGFVDLILKKDDQLIFRDYKFGLNPPKNWKTNRLKKYEELMTDVQMCIYYYCVKRVFGDEPLAQLWYVATKKPKKYILPIDDDCVESILEDIKLRYEALKATKMFARQCDWDIHKCIRLKCPFASMNMAGMNMEHLNIIHEPRRDTFDPVDGKACVCDTIAFFNQHRTPEQIQQNCTKKYER